VHDATQLLNEATRLLHLATECSDRAIRRKLNCMADEFVNEAARCAGRRSRLRLVKAENETSARHE
jgi:hypothetical protein